MAIRSAHLRVFSLALAAGLAAAAVSAAPTQHSSSSKTTTFRWVDDQGVVHYGDQIPPQYAGKDREIMNPQGVPVSHVEGQKSPDQVAKEARARAELIRQKQHDTFLVTTYTSVKDIESLRDARLDQLKTQRAAGQQYIESLKARLGALQTRALAYRPYSGNAGARSMPDDLAENLVRTVNEMNTQTNALARESEDETQLRAQFQADIERYKELHTLHSTD
ncbi:MAG TPA: DUF4124 domain-containing protein [Steroidobacteraceae bacterium]|nr:DUF4124 domain-containing protein [Steroidobacteraceae bacterium]